MSPAFCRRRFLTNGLLLAGAVALLPTRRLYAASLSPAGAGALPSDAPMRAVLALVGDYADVGPVTAGATATRITARVRCYDSMARALGNARAHGISSIQSAGNLTSFDLEGRRFEVENLPTAA